MSHYAYYNQSQSRRSLDLDTIPSNTSVSFFPSSMGYKKGSFVLPNPISTDTTLSSNIRGDGQWAYTIGKDRCTHPDTPSTFGYARCPNGYCLGTWSAGTYNDPSIDEQPKDMAPKHLYPINGGSMCH